MISLVARVLIVVAVAIQLVEKCRTMWVAALLIIIFGHAALDCGEAA
jgi:hypothetical protein